MKTCDPRIEAEKTMKQIIAEMVIENISFEEAKKRIVKPFPIPEHLTCKSELMGAVTL